MEHTSEIVDGPPLAYRFVRQSSRKVDESSHSAIRSHAMKEFRKRQRQQKQLEIVQSGQQSVVENGISLCRCLTLAQLSPPSSEQHSKRRRLHTPPTPFSPTPEPCCLCRRVQSLRMSSSQHMNALQQLSSPIATFSAADFDPFNSIIELPPSLTSKFSSEINVIKTHG
jgi:hypothetical protein